MSLQSNTSYIRTLNMERHFLFVFTVFLFFISFSESFIEQQTLSEAVATLQQTVNGLQGRVTVLENTCGKSSVYMDLYMELYMDLAL